MKQMATTYLPPGAGRIMTTALPVEAASRSRSAPAICCSGFTPLMLARMRLRCSLADGLRHARSSGVSAPSTCTVTSRQPAFSQGVMFRL